jgi:hypothetical protein
VSQNAGINNNDSPTTTAGSVIANTINDFSLRLSDDDSAGLVGDEEGTDNGVAEGEEEGSEEGILEGRTLGPAEGVALVGAAVGTREGVKVGTVDGVAVGTADTLVGSTVGARDGVAVRATLVIDTVPVQEDELKQPCLNVSVWHPVVTVYLI